MARITVEDCLAKEPNRFALVLLAAKRTKQLLLGAKTLLPHVKNKPVVTALREIATGDVRFMTDEDMQKLKEREKTAREARLAEQASGVIEDRIKTQAILSADDLFINSPKAVVDDDDDDDDGDEVDPLVDAEDGTEDDLDVEDIEDDESDDDSDEAPDDEEGPLKE